MKLLWVSPLPPIRSGVSDYAVELLTELHRLTPVRVVAPPGWQPTSHWPFGDELEVVGSDTAPDDDELQLVHLGNNPYHEWLLPRLGQPHTVVVMHDMVVHHLLVEATLARGRSDEFRALLERAHPEAAGALADARDLGITGRRDPFLFPARRSLLGNVSGVLVHSRRGQQLLAAELPDVPVRRIGLPVADPGPVDRARARQEIGVDEGAVLLMHLGFLTLEKGIGTVLSALTTAHRQGLDVRLTVVGEGGERSRLDAAARALGVDRLVSFTGWVAAEVLPGLPAAADLGVVLRVPSAGETSAAAVRFLACGTPVAVTGIHQFLEWPPAAAPRITPGPPASGDLYRLLAEAASGGASWLARRTDARAAYEAGHRPAAVAGQILDALSVMVA